MTHDSSRVDRTFADEEVDVQGVARFFLQPSLEEKAAQIEVLNVGDIAAAVAIPKSVNAVVRRNARRCSACIDYILLQSTPSLRSPDSLWKRLYRLRKLFSSGKV